MKPTDMKAETDIEKRKLVLERVSRWMLQHGLTMADFDACTRVGRVLRKGASPGPAPNNREIQQKGATIPEPKIYDDLDSAIAAENPNEEVGKSVHFFVRDQTDPFIAMEYKLTLTRSEEMSKAEWAESCPTERVN
jgi:hypothetical protein